MMHRGVAVAIRIGLLHQSSRINRHPSIAEAILTQFRGRSYKPALLLSTSFLDSSFALLDSMLRVHAECDVARFARTLFRFVFNPRSFPWATFAVAVLVTSALHAAGDWVDYRIIGKLHIRSEFRLQDAGAVVRELGQLSDDIEETLKIKISKSPIHLHFFQSRRSYVQYLADRVPEGTKWKALFVKGDDAARVYAHLSSSFETDVRHESTHAVLHNSLEFIPLWLDEGLAEYFEISPNRRVAGHGHLSSMRWAIRFGWRPRLKQLEDKNDLGDMGQRDYRNSWAWVHFMLHESVQSKQALVGYLAMIQQGRAPGPMSEWINSRIPNADARVIRHLKTWGR